MEEIINISSNYALRRRRIVITAVEPTQIVGPNPSRWAIRIVNGRAGTIFISPFPQDADFPGIAIPIEDDWWTYLSRDPVLTGLQWFAWTSLFIPPPTSIEVWETTPTGT